MESKKRKCSFVNHSIIIKKLKINHNYNNIQLNKVVNHNKILQSYITYLLECIRDLEYKYHNNNNYVNYIS